MMKNIKPSFIRRVEYFTLLDDKAPISYYDLYDDGKHRFAMITFYNNAKYTILSFKVKFTFYTKNKDFLSTAVYQLKPKDFRVHHDFELSDPLLMPKDADGFNYEIFDVVYPDHDQLRREKLRIKFGNIENDKVIAPVKENIFFKWKWLGALSLGVAALGIIAIPVTNNIIHGSSNSNTNYNDNQNDNQNDNVVSYNGWEFLVERDTQTTGYVITGWQAARDSSLYIPSNVGGKEITRIASDAFNGLGIIDDIYFENSNLVVSANAFSSCDSLSQVNGHVGTIGKYAFEGCNNLNSVSLNANEIGQYAFNNCNNLFNAEIYNCSTIDSYAFYNLNNLNTVTLDVNQINTYAFANCYNLNSVSITSCSRIGNRAFDEDTNITYCHISSDCTVSGTAFPSNVQVVKDLI